ncbi:hypothetical protein D9619_013330 [Psilocybe cf. subviscida]|uniref:Endonuclease/exonuclease/phosphatase domain-containing protein n=1 Tax=Psilocybe cf. subviscida TaxID=2480587 RepID=A0A8H5F966_9AGAR|nr:hypothetical protein D9619_013330 [Psilocybe cf. subviscida]
MHAGAATHVPPNDNCEAAGGRARTEQEDADSIQTRPVSCPPAREAQQDNTPVARLVPNARPAHDSRTEDTHQVGHTPHTACITQGFRPETPPRTEVQNATTQDGDGSSSTANTSTEAHHTETSGTKSRCCTRAGITIASLNMNGRMHGNVDKWEHVNQIIRDEKIGILALQETHASQQSLVSVIDTHEDRLHILTTLDEGRPNAGGVAIVVNKYLADTSRITTHVIDKGKALYTTIPWHRNHSINVLAVYAPNDHGENEDFWKKINEKLRPLPSVDVLLGDLNITEDNID